LLCCESEDGFPLSRKRFTTAKLVNDGDVVPACVNEKLGASVSTLFRRYLRLIAIAKNKQRFSYLRAA
jgi:hypothetical protein